MAGRVYRTREWLAFGHGRWHLLTCPFCRGARRWLREQEQLP